MRSGTATKLSRETLVGACLRIADSEGPEAVTLRRLGAELGVDPTAVYRHFRDKDELLAATADRVLTDALNGFTLTGSWKEDVRNLTLRMRAAYLRHPKIALLVLTATAPFTNEAQLTETGLAIIRGAGFGDEEAIEVFEVVEAYTLAVSCMDAMASSTDPDAWRRSFAALPPDRFPNLTETAPLLYVDPDRRFSYGLDLLLEAIDARRGRT